MIKLLFPLVPGVLALAAVTAQNAEGLAKWPLWESYADHFIDGDGRVIDFDSEDRTTSEGQSYVMFFALVANDRERFARVLGWTERNLTSLGLKKQLPAWMWGKGPDGAWGMRDGNSASDSDLWIAYTLIQGGGSGMTRHWATSAKHWRRRSRLTRSSNRQAWALIASRPADAAAQSGSA